MAAAAGEMAARYEMEGFAGRALRVLAFAEVANAAELRAAILAGQLRPEAALINATVVAGETALLSAAAKALLAAGRGRLITKGLHSEVVFALAGSKHISEALRRFGVGEDTTSLLVATFDADDAALEQLAARVQGRLLNVSAPGRLAAHLQAVADAQLLCKYYKVGETELGVGPLEDAVVSRIASLEMM